MYILPQYKHIVNPKLKHIYLSFDALGGLVIKSPNVSLQKIEHLLFKKASWIEKSREKLQQKKGKAVDFSGVPELYFKGEAYPVLLQEHTKKKTALVFDETYFTLLYHRYDEIHFQKHIDHFYKIEAKKEIPLLVGMWAETMSVSPADIRFRKTKRQWGSCSVKNVLSFNTMIMKLPQDVIQYIIVHELAHIRHKHHQKSFWKEVETYLPGYKDQVGILKNYTT